MKALILNILFSLLATTATMFLSIAMHHWWLRIHHGPTHTHRPRRHLEAYRVTPVG